MSSEITPHLRNRRSSRAYSANTPVTHADVDAVLEAARWAPSGSNGQPWRFVVARQGQPDYDKVLALLMPFNKAWASHAPVLILSVALINRVTSDGKTVANDWAWHDTGMANLAMAIEATARGLNMHMMAGFDRTAAKGLLDTEHTGLDPVCVITLGHIGDDSHLSDDQKKRETEPRARKPVQELLISL